MHLVDFAIERGEVEDQRSREMEGKAGGEKWAVIGCYWSGSACKKGATISGPAYLAEEIST